MRTNIVLDDELVREAMALSGETTKTAVIHRALREFLQRQRLLDFRAHFGKIQWDGDLDQMRERQPSHGTARRHQRHR
jgi:Arc/MetJ family transcription regulator